LEAPKAALVPGTGDYSRSISTNSALAQQFFDQGLRLVYGYYFPEAAASFMEALRHDPHPMIEWGLALSIGPNPNSRYFGAPDDPFGEGRKAIERAQGGSIRATDVERDFINALAVRFDVESHPDTTSRDAAYLESARSLAERHPGDDDASTLYADAFMTSSAWRYWDREGKPATGTPDAARALERVMDRNLTHPGANHLYIHLLEASREPERALPQADRLADLMPNAGHIVHMPSHIYVRVGMYDKAISTNERSLAADETFLAVWGDTPFPTITTHPLSARIHAGHSMSFIRYAATIQGNYGRALGMARSAAALLLTRMPLSSTRVQRPVTDVWLVHKIFGRWDALLAESGPPETGHPYLDGIWHYTRGSARAARGEPELARQELARLRTTAEDPAVSDLLVAANPAAKLLKIAALGLQGEIAQAAGDMDQAVDAFREAVRLEDSLGYVEPPAWGQPMRHYLGAALVAAKRPAEAEGVYRDDLAWNQENGWSLYGLWQSLRDQGKAGEAEAIHTRFVEAWRGADVTLQASRF
jgi:tetratricopeptide (TPR) repeat protein